MSALRAEISRKDDEINSIEERCGHLVRFEQTNRFLLISQDTFKKSFHYSELESKETKK